MSVKRYVVISCAILHREVCYLVAKTKNIVDIIFKEKGLHDLKSEKMQLELQDVINQIDCNKYDAILLCYGLCNNGVVNLHAEIPLVIPRAHDCITLLMGARESYDKYFAENPGTYFHSSGWLERNESDNPESIGAQNSIGKSYEDFVDEYGEENADYLYSILGNWMNHYNKIAFINNGIGDVNRNRKISESFAVEKGWVFDEVLGNISLIKDLIDGNWNEKDFLVIPPGKKIVPSFDSCIVKYDG